MSIGGVMNDPVFRNVRFLPGTIHAGFPSHASDYEERELDINDLVVPHPTTGYFMRVDGDSMTGACIYSGDIIDIDRAVTAANNRIVVARIGEDFTLKRLQIMQNRKIFLKPENPKYIWLSLRIGNLVCFRHHYPAIIRVCQKSTLHQTHSRDARQRAGAHRT